MSGALMLAQIRLRRRWSSIVVIGLLVAIAGGVVLTGLAGARRTRSALDRLGQETNASTVGVLLFDGPNARFAARVGHITGVEQSGQLVVWAASIVDSTGEDTPVVAAVDDRFGRTVDRSILVKGRRARGAAEVVVSDALARRKGYRVGSRIRVATFGADQLAEVRASQTGLTQPEPRGPMIPLRVVGIDRRVGDLSTQGERTGILYLAAPVYRQYGDRVLAFAGLVRVRLPEGGTTSFTKRFGAIAQGRNTAFDTGGLDTGGVDDSLTVLAAGLLLFSALAALGALVTLTVLLARWASSWSREQPIELALGQRSGARVGAVALPVIPALIAGGLGAGVLAAITSAWMPIGAARAIEPHHGVDIDPLVLGAGLLTIVFVSAALTMATAWWGTRRARWDATRRHRGATAARIVGTITRWRLPVPAVVGSRMALDPGTGSTAVPGRTAIAAAALGTAGIVAALVVGASMQHLGDQPKLWAYRYDAIIEGGGGLTHQPDEPSCATVRTTVSSLRSVAAVANLCQTSVTIDGTTVNAVGLGPIRGTIRPLVLRGRAPVGPTEVALGEKTLSRIGRSLGDRVIVEGETGRVRARIVGTTVIPTPNSHDTVTLADGALMRADALARLGAGSFPQIVVRWRPGTDIGRAQQQVKRITGARAIAPVRPPEVDRLLQVDDLPAVLAAFLGLLALVGVAHAVVTNATRRRRDLALLQTLGFRTGQVVETIAAHATTLALLGMVVGIPIGIVAGRATWTAIAHGVGVGSDPSVPWWLLGVMVLAIIFAVLVVAAIPARRASRSHPAIALRGE